MLDSCVEPPKFSHKCVWVGGKAYPITTPPHYVRDSSSALDICNTKYKLPIQTGTIFASWTIKLCSECDSV